MVAASMRILCTNDDGYNSHGIRALIGIAERLGHTVAVAPEGQQGGTVAPASMPTEGK